MEEDFEDALEELETLERPKKRDKVGKMTSRGQEQVPLNEALEDARKAIDLFLNNDFKGSKAIVEPLADRSIYHALGYSIFVYLEAVMTFERDLIEKATQVLNETSQTINGFRKKNGGGIIDSLGRLASRKLPNYYDCSEDEAHAELCYAEVLLLRAILTLCEDENLVSFVKAGLKVRNCFQSFRECWHMLHQRDWKNPQTKSDFETGVRMGVGSFNLLISLLPARIMRLLEFIGFGGAKDGGLSDLMMVYEDKKGLRQFLAAIALLGYNLFINYFLGNREVDLKLCDIILKEKLSQYPKGIFFQFFKGRYHLIQGQLGEAIKWYTMACNSDWQQLHHICYWELIWCHQFSLNWRSADHLAGKLLAESKWSKTFYSYLKASILCMMQDDLTGEQLLEQNKLMNEAPQWKQRIAGKSLPMEKFAIAKAKRFQDQGGRLTLPILELIYLWNGFKILSTSFQTVEPFYVMVEQKLSQGEPENKYKDDNYCLVLLLKGMCLKSMKSPLQAQECFKNVMSFAGKLKGDKYLIPYATFEYATILKDEEKQLEAAMRYLEHAKNDYKDYHLQSRLHFRIHAAQTDLRTKLSAGKVEAAASAVEEDEFLDAESGDEDFKSHITEENAMKILNKSVN